MKTLTLMAAVILSGTLGAQTPATMAEKRVQIFGEFSRPKQFVLAQPNGDLWDQAAAQLGVGLRVMGEVPGTNSWFYEFGGKFEGSSKLGYNQTFVMPAPSPGVAVNSTDVTIKYSYWEFGTAYLWDVGSNFFIGAHLDLRSETISAQGKLVVGPNPPYTGGGTVDQRGTMMRAWVRVSADYVFQGAGLRPYFGADLAYTPFHSSQNSVVPFVALDDRTLKAMATQFGASLYFGLKF